MSKPDENPEIETLSDEPSESIDTLLNELARMLNESRERERQSREESEAYLQKYEEIAEMLTDCHDKLEDMEEENKRLRNLMADLGHQKTFEPK